MSAAYYVCTTKVDFPAAEAPRVRLSSHRSFGCPARYVCTTKVDFPATEHYGFSTATMRTPAEGVRLYVRKRKSTRVLALRQRRNLHAEGLRFYVTKRKNMTVLAPRNAQTHRGLSATTNKSTKNDGFSTATRRSPAEGCPRKSRDVKKRRF